MTIDGQTLHMSASLGISVYPDDGADAEHLLHAAEAARAQIRHGLGNRLHFFTPGMDTRARRWIAVESALRHALARGELQLYYQPMVCVRHGRVRTVEALLRWNSPELGWVSPAEFIPVAEESELIVAIGDWVLETACRQVRHWQDTGLPPIRVAVNVSAHQLASGRLPERVREVLERSGIAPGQLEIELTESAMMSDSEHSARQVEAISRMGVSVSLDDFGTGYSSLAYLSRFALTKLKIDRSFVDGLTRDPKSSIIVDVHPGPGARTGPARGGRGSGDGGAARAARRRRLRCAAGLPVQPAGGAGRPRRADRPLRAGRALREAAGGRRQRLIGAPSPLSAAARSWPGAATTG